MPSNLIYLPDSYESEFVGGGGGCTASVTKDAITFTANQSTGTTLSTAFTTATSTDVNTGMFLYLLFDGSGASVSSCTYNSVTMTIAGTAAHDGTNNQNASLYWVMNPATGSHTLACTGTSVNEYYYMAQTFHNVNASTPVRPGSYQTGTGKSLTISSNSQDWSISAIENSSSTTSSNQTNVRNGGGTFSAGADLAITPASSVTHTWTASGTSAMAGLSVQCK